MLPMKTADSREIMSVPHEKQIFADKFNVTHELERVKRYRMRVFEETFAAE